MTSQTPETFYKSIFENMTDGLAYCQMIFDAQKNPVDWIYIKVNKNFEKLTGLKNAKGKKVSKLIPGISASNPELFKIYGQVSLTGKPERFETYVAPLSRWFLVSVFSPQKNFFVALFQNITDRKQIEKNLEDARIAAVNVLDDLFVEKSKVETAKAKEEAILMSIGDGLITTDEKGNTIFINKAAEKLLGIKNEEISGKSFFESTTIENEEGVAVPLEKRPIHMALATGTTTTTTTTTTTGPTYYYVRKDKTKFPAAITVTPVILSGKVIGAIGVFHDITKEREIDHAKSEFVSLASHQLRTPLTAIGWYVEMLQSGDAGVLNDKQNKYLSEIYTGNKRMVELVNALLNVSRIELGTFVVEPEPTDVVLLARSVVNEQKSQIEAKKLKLSEKYAKDLPLFNADPKLLRMVFQNLLSNAVKYTPKGGAIEFALWMVKGGESVDVQKADEDSIAVKVTDAGYGIPKKQQNQIFTKFFRADNVRKKDTEGTGLGLYIVKAIVDHSGSKIWFESVENKGAIFYVTLPLSGMKKKEGAKALI